MGFRNSQLKEDSAEVDVDSDGDLGDLPEPSPPAVPVVQPLATSVAKPKPRKKAAGFFDDDDEAKASTVSTVSAPTPTPPTSFAPQSTEKPQVATSVTGHDSFYDDTEVCIRCSCSGA